MNESLFLKRKSVYLTLFIFLNPINAFLITTPIFSRYLSTYPRDLFMIINYVLGDLGVMACFLALAILLFRNDYKRFRFLMIVSIIQSVLCIAASIYIYQYGSIFSFRNLQAFSNPAGGMALDFVIASLEVLIKHAQFLTLLPSIVFIVYFSRFKKEKNNPSFQQSMFGKQISRLFLGGSVAVIGILMMLNSVNAYQLKIKDTWIEEEQNVLYGIQHTGFFNYYIYEAYRTYIEKQPPITQQVQDEILAYYESKQNDFQMNAIDNQVYSNRFDWRGMYRGQNLILIQAESLSNFLIGLEVDGVEVTPFLNEMVKNGIYFPNFYTTVGIGNTSDAEFSVMTGLYPNGDNLSVYEFGKAEYATLAKDFNKSSYHTFSIHGNVSSFYSRNTVFPDLYGFDVHYGLEHLNKVDPYVHNWISDWSLLTQTVEKMKESPESDFAYPILLSCHTPYLDDDVIDTYLDSIGFDISILEEDPLLMGYLKHQRYVDASIANMVLRLGEEGLLENTVIGIYGDHGGGIDARSFMAFADVLHNPTYPLDEALFDEADENHVFSYRLLKNEVPFILYEGAANKKINPQEISLSRGLVDIYRSLSNLFGLSSQYYFGVDMFGDAPSYIYHPRSLDVFYNGGIASLPAQKTYLIDTDFAVLNAVVSEHKRNNDLLLRYLNSLQE